MWVSWLPCRVVTVLAKFDKDGDGLIDDHEAKVTYAPTRSC